MKSETSGPILHWEIPSTTEAAERLSGELMDKIRQGGFGEEDQFAIHLALEEALINAVVHGNCGDPEKRVVVRAAVTEEKFDVTITDEGPGFDPDTVPDPREPENLLKCSGRGVLLIYAYMDTVEFHDGGCSIRMVKYKGAKRSKKNSSGDSV